MSTRMPNTYKLATSNYHNYECPVQLKKSKTYFNFPPIDTLHRNDLTWDFILSHQTAHIIVTDDTKVIGYLQYGQYFSLRNFY